MFHAGIEETIRRFEQREGITVDRIYNGCGMLVSQMLAGGMPEAYLSCDSTYMDKVADRFRTPVVLSENDMVIVVKKGNPLGIAELADLAIPTHRVGLCHPTDSALGSLTKRLLTATNLESIYDDPTLMVATGPMLMNAIAAGRQGGLDAAIVYRSNVLSNPDNLDRVEILEIEKVDRRLTRATQPWAIAKETDNPRLLGRLYEALISRASQDAFTAVGFRWLLNPVEP
jgi:ABC-type molybdate transport system substrate-binding protein